MHHLHLGRQEKCYLSPEFTDDLEAFLPLLTDVSCEAARSAFVASLFLNLLEVRIQSNHLAYLVKSGTSWMRRYPNDSSFWVELGIGRRVSALLEKMIESRSEQIDLPRETATELDALLDAMVKTGVTPARAGEKAIATRR